jgi:hypothetical protein
MVDGHLDAVFGLSREFSVDGERLVEVELGRSAVIARSLVSPRILCMSK